MYSDMSFHPETGDVGGMEVFIALAIEAEKPRYVGWVQWATGSPRTPVLVEVTVNGSEIGFTIPASAGGAGAFQGQIVANVLEGQFKGTGEHVKLPRRISFWQQ